MITNFIKDKVENFFDAEVYADDDDFEEDSKDLSTQIWCSLDCTKSSIFQLSFQNNLHKILF